MLDATSYDNHHYIIKVPSCGAKDAGSKGSIEINAKFLDTEKLKNSFKKARLDVDHQITNFNYWLTSKENEFAMNYWVKGLSRDKALFNKVNIAIAKIRKSMKIVDSWHLKYHELISKAEDNIDKYVIAMEMIKTLGSTKCTENDMMPEDKLTLAKENVKRIKSLEKQMNLARTAEAKIKAIIPAVQKQWESFMSGEVTFDRETVNTREIGIVLDGLMGNDSSLKRVQDNLAERANDSNTTLNFESVIPNYNTSPENNTVSGYKTDNTVESNSAISNLKFISNVLFYNERSQEHIDEVIRIANSAIGIDHHLRDQADKLINIIRNNTLENMIKRYRDKVKEVEDIEVTINNLKLFINQLDPYEQVVHSAELQSILSEGVNLHENIMHTDQNE